MLASASSNISRIGTNSAGSMGSLWGRGKAASNCSGCPRLRVITLLPRLRYAPSAIACSLRIRSSMASSSAYACFSPCTVMEKSFDRGRSSHLASNRRMRASHYVASSQTAFSGRSSNKVRTVSAGMRIVRLCRMNLRRFSSPGKPIQRIWNGSGSVSPVQRPGEPPSIWGRFPSSLLRRSILPSGEWPFYSNRVVCHLSKHPKHRLGKTYADFIAVLILFLPFTRLCERSVAGTTTGCVSSGS